MKEQRNAIGHLTIEELSPDLLQDIREIAVEEAGTETADTTTFNASGYQEGHIMHGVNDVQSAIDKIASKVSEGNLIVETVDAKKVTIGERGPVGPPNFNNLYVEGAIYMDSSTNVNHVTGPGAVGGNIYLPEGKAICGLTKEGPITNPDGTKDSGVRTIGFVAKVQPEDIANNESSVYLGTNASRLYLYSKTAFPTVVSQVNTDDVKESAGNFDTPMPTEKVETVSPIATQSWVMDLLKSVGVIGGQDDTSAYSYAARNPNMSFDLMSSYLWTYCFGFDWITNEDGTIGMNTNKNDKFSFVPLIKKGVWNEVYFNVFENSYDKMYYTLMSTDEYFFCVTLNTNTYTTFCINKSGKKINENTSLLKANLQAGTNRENSIRFKYDSTNEEFGFSMIDANNIETPLLVVSKYAMTSYPQFSKANISLGFMYTLTNHSSLVKLKDRPAGFMPSNTTSKSAVVRQREKDVLKQEIKEEIFNTSNTYDIKCDKLNQRIIELEQIIKSLSK